MADEKTPETHHCLAESMEEFCFSRLGILKTLWNKNMTAYAERRGILTPCQLGFRSYFPAQDANSCSFESMPREIENRIVHAAQVIHKKIDSLSHFILTKNCIT